MISNFECLLRVLRGVTSPREPGARTDAPRGKFHHTNWTGRGGETASSTYNV